MTDPIKSRPIFLTTDLDGVQFHAPAPIGVVPNLLLGQIKLSKSLSKPEVYIPPTSIIKKMFVKISFLAHKYRKLKKEGLPALLEIQKLGNVYNRQIKFGVLTGREKDKHILTLSVLEKAGYKSLISNWFLNEGNNSSLWKEWSIKNLVNKGYTVIHLEDDLRAALSITRNKPKVLVYLFKNISTHPKLLKRAGLILPPNIILVKNFQEVVFDIEKRFTKGEI